MDLTQDLLAKFAGKLLATGQHVVLLQLQAGERITGPELAIEGPAIVELTVYRDGGWKVREPESWSTTAVALWTSL